MPKPIGQSLFAMVQRKSLTLPQSPILNRAVGCDFQILSELIQLFKMADLSLCHLQYVILEGFYPWRISLLPSCSLKLLYLKCTVQRKSLQKPSQKKVLLISHWTVHIQLHHASKSSWERYRSIALWIWDNFEQVLVESWAKCSRE